MYGISIRQLVLMHWTAGPDSPTYLLDFTIFFIQLNNVSNEIENEVWPPYVKLSLPQIGTQGIPLPLIQ